MADRDVAGACSGAVARLIPASLAMMQSMQSVSVSTAT